MTAYYIMQRALTRPLNQSAERMAKQPLLSINDLVRWLFAAGGVFVFVYFGNTSKESCDSAIFGVKTNSTQVLGVLLIALGLGAPIIMKYLAGRKADAGK